MNPPVPAARRGRFRVIVTGMAVVMVALGILWWRQRVPVPQVSTAGLDPAVARLLEEQLAAVRSSPRSADAWGRLGSAMMHYDFVEEAAAALSRAAQLAPRDPRWPHLHGLLRLNRDAPAAVAGFQEAVARDERATASRLRLAQTLAELGRAAEAEAQFRVLAGAGDVAAPAALGLARIRLGEGRTLEASNELARCLADPHTARAAWALLSTVRQKLGDVAGAQAAARQSALLPPDAPWPDPVWEEARSLQVGRLAWLAEANALLDQGRVAEALPILSRVTRDYPQEPEGWYVTGWALNQLDRAAEAEHALREHVRLEPGSAKGHAQLAVALLAQRRAAEAIPVLEAGRRLKPTWREFHFNLGYACVLLGREDEAMGHFQQALVLDPNFVPTYTALAELLWRRGRTAEAQQLVREAQERCPGDPRIQALRQRLGEARP